MVVADLVQPIEEPKLLPKGTRIEVDFWYDSTPERGRQRGFDADRPVGFGPRTNDEMSAGFITYGSFDGAGRRLEHAPALYIELADDAPSPG